jgi:sugar phosphate isomerase/epimerase
MDITLGCSLDDLRTHAAYRAHAFINVEDPLHPGYLDQDTRADLAYLASEPRQRLVLDGPYIDLNLGSPEPKARQLAKGKAREALAFAEACSAETVVFLSTFLPFIGLDFYERGWIEESLRSWREILAGAPARVRIALCNTFEYNPENLIELVETLDHPGLELAFDVGHCLVWGRLPVVEWYRRIRDRCRIVYLHSNDGQADQHRSIRTGVLAEQNVLPALVDELRSDSLVILKYFEREGVEADIRYLESTMIQAD